MSVYLPDGVLLSLATTYASSLPITSITNASPPVVTSAAHGLANGDIVEVTSGWNGITGRLIRVSAVSTNNFSLEGEDSTSTALYPAGTGTGTVRKVTAFTQILQVTDVSTTGGEPQYAEYQFLENDFTSQIPTASSAQSLAMTVGDDPSLAGYAALKAASKAKAIRGLKAYFPNGSTSYYNGYVFVNETPTLTKGSIATVNASFALTGVPTRYAS